MLNKILYWLITFCFALPLCIPFAPAAYGFDGGIPNQAYPSNQLFEIISPQMSTRHQNQPSVFNGYVMLAGNAHHEVWDISNTSAPQLVGEMVSNHNAGEAESHQVTYGSDGLGNYFMVTVSGRGIDIWNVTNTTNPTLTAELILPGINYGDVAGAIWGVTWQGNHIFCGATTNGVYVVDVSTPSNPQLVATVPRTQLGGVSAGPLFAFGDLLVVTTPKNTAGIATVDISDPVNPVLLDSVSPSEDSYVGGFHGGNAFLITPYRAYDVTTDPTNITLIGNEPVPDSEYVAFADDHLFLGGLRGGSQGVWKYDISDPSNPNLVGRVIGRSGAWDDQFCCPAGNLLIIADDQFVNNQNVGAVIAVHDNQQDNLAPTVKLISPSDGATDHALSGQIAISFSEWPEFRSVDPSSFIVRKQSDQTVVAGKFGCTYTTLTFAPNDPLEPETVYTIELPAGGITDLVSNAIAQTFTSTFETETAGVQFDYGEEIVAPPATALGQTTNFSIGNAHHSREYSWMFGDGNSGTGMSPTHQYGDVGRYVVTVQASNMEEANIEAEDTILQGGVSPASNNPGHTGAGYADFPGSGGSVTWNLNRDRRTASDIVFRYANGGSSGTRVLNLRVNGGAPQPIQFVHSGAWTNYVEVTAANVLLLPGANSIALTGDAGTPGPNVDNMTVIVDRYLESENGTLENTSIVNSAAGNTGTGFVTFPGNVEGKIIWNLDVLTPQSVDLDIDYSNSSAAIGELELRINGVAATVNFPITSGTNDWRSLTVPISLVVGSNIIELVSSPGNETPNIDHVRIPHPNPGGEPVTLTASHTVHHPLTASQPTRDSSIILAENQVWVVNPDSDTVTTLNVNNSAVNFEVPVGSEPKSIAEAPDGNLWVVCRKSWNIHVLDSSGSDVDVIELPYASRPIGLAFAADGSAAFVTLQATGTLLKLNPANGAIVDSLELGEDANGIMRNIRGVAVSGDSSKVYVTRFISPDGQAEVYEIDSDSMLLSQTIELQKDIGIDSPSFSRGIPNYLASLTISPDGLSAWVPSKKDNIDRGGFLDGLGFGHDTTVRSITSVVDLVAGTESYDLRIDHDNADRCHSCTFNTFGDLAFLTFPGNNLVKVIDVYGGSEVASIPCGKAPEGLVIDENSGQLFIHNFMSRDVTVIDISGVLAGQADTNQIASIPVVANEALSPSELLGKEIFYDASSTQLNLEGYMSCASCHLDGSHDGRTYDFSIPMLEGFRNTIDLRGRAGTAHGPMHWSANFDETHDFENQIRLLGAGSGLMDDADFNATSDPLGDPKAGLSFDLDAMADYLASLDSFEPSPFRNQNGTLTADAQLGKQHFAALNCANCHSGSDFTDSNQLQLHDVGTIVPTSGERAGSPLTGLDTPTLRGIWSTAPYLHDGSALTIRDVLTTRNIGDQHGAVSSLSSTHVDELVAYLKQIDGLEPAPSFVPTSVQTFRGTAVIAPQLSDFIESDNVRARYNPGFTLNGTEAPVWLVFTGNGSGATEFSIESHVNTPSLSYTIELNNYTTNSYDVVGVLAASFNADIAVTYQLDSNNVNTDGEVKSRVGWRRTGFTLLFPWEVCVDQAGWNQ